MKMRPCGPAAALVLLALLPAQASAIDKQGSAHGGKIGGPESGGFAWSGSLLAGISVYNPSYAARPDNSGLALMRYAAHADLDLMGRRLSVPLDVNTFTDRERSGLGKLAISELDLIIGLTSTFAVGPGALELGARVEQDRGVDRPVPTQTYVDARGRYLLAFGDLRLATTLGWFVINRSYYARPDNTGKALFRYGLHPELAITEHVAAGVDATMFTDREAASPVRPSELDLAPELIVRQGAFEAHLAYERDMCIDRAGLMQHFVYVLLAWGFTGG
jgi:hypothetical protein